MNKNPEIVNTKAFGKESKLEPGVLDKFKEVELELVCCELEEVVSKVVGCGLGSQSCEKRREAIEHHDEGMSHISRSREGMATH